MIKKIEISNIKGIGHGTSNSKVEFDLPPNKPIILVAPNGYGKSSIAIAFKALNSNKINLHKNDFHKGNDSLIPSIKIEYIDSSGRTVNLSADNSSNNINNDFDTFVINSQIYAKAKKSRIRGNVIATASIEIPEVVLIKTIPEKVYFGYMHTSAKAKIGINGKVISNINSFFSNKKFISVLRQSQSILDRMSGITEQREILAFLAALNSQSERCTKQQLISWIEDEQLTSLEEINYLTQLKEIISEFDFGLSTSAEKYLAAIQVYNLYNNNKPRFKKAWIYSDYLLEKEAYKQIFKSFNSTWKDVVPKETGGSLILELPKVNHISNGQRDVLCFIALLQKAELKLKKSNCILIIDEVFDYLDDANLIAVQFYVTKFINKFSTEGKKIYPIILTHLNPYYFRNFAFSKQKTYFLNKTNAMINPHFRKVLLKREDALIKDDISKYHLHYHPDEINIRAEFTTLNLKPTWGESGRFNSFIEAEYIKYSTGEDNFDPFAVCCAVRKKIEKKAYSSITNTTFKEEFIDTHTTPKKLKYAEDKGVEIPEVYYLLGIIYNDGLHYKNNDAAIAGKLKNITIREMIKELD